MSEHPSTGHLDAELDPVGDADVLAALHSAHALLLDEPDPSPDTPAEVPRRPGPGRRDLRPWLAGALAVAVLAGGAALATGVHRQQTRAPEVAGSPLQATTTTLAGQSLAPDPALPARSGWKWVSVYGVELQVPMSWGWGDDANITCGSRATGPHVGIPAQAITAEGCARTTLPASMAPVVDVLDSSAPVAWTSTQRVVGGRRVAVGWGSAHDDAATRRTAREVLDSARSFVVDDNGCPQAMPDVSPGGFDQITGATRAAVCQYQLQGGTWLPQASAGLDKTPASRLATAIVTAPEGSGPASSCTGDETGRIMVRFETPTGVHTLALHYDGCGTPNGYVAGDGVHHRLTRANCHDAMVVPVNVKAMSSAPAAMCML